jgi:hypothetical protein
VGKHEAVLLPFKKHKPLNRAVTRPRDTIDALSRLSGSQFRPKLRFRPNDDTLG